MDKSLKRQALAMLCTKRDQNLAPGSWLPSGWGKKRQASRKTRGNLRGKGQLRSPCGSPPVAKSSWVGRGTMLRRCTEEKQPCAVAVAVEERLKHRTPADLREPAKAQKIAGCLFPDHTAVRRAYIRQVVKSSQHPMGTSQAEDDNPQPAGNQPWGYEAFRVHCYRSAMKALLPHLPALDA